MSVEWLVSGAKGTTPRFAKLRVPLVIGAGLATVVTLNVVLEVGSQYAGSDSPVARRLLAESQLADLPGDAELTGCSGNAAASGYPALAYFVTLAARRSTVEQWASTWRRKAVERDLEGKSRTTYTCDGTTIKVTGGFFTADVHVLLSTLPVVGMTERCFDAMA
jgi:hypothetical protein